MRQFSYRRFAFELRPLNIFASFLPVPFPSVRQRHRVRCLVGLEILPIIERMHHDLSLDAVYPAHPHAAPVIPEPFPGAISIAEVHVIEVPLSSLEVRE